MLNVDITSQIGKSLNKEDGQRNIEALSRIYFRRGKAIGIKY